MKIKTLQYLVVPRANKGEDAFKWVAFYSDNQAQEPYVHADTPEEALRLFEAARYRKGKSLKYQAMNEMMDEEN